MYIYTQGTPRAMDELDFKTSITTIGGLNIINHDLDLGTRIPLQESWIRVP